MNKKNSRIGIACLLLALGSLAIPQQTFNFKDKAGKLDIKNAGSLKGTRISEDPEKWKVVLHAAGSNPIVAIWEDQDLTLRSRTFQAVTERVGKAMEIETANLGGGVTITALRPSGQRSSNTKQTITLMSQTLDFFGDENRAELKGGVTVDQKDAAAQSSMTARGASGTVVLTDADAKGAKGPIQSAVLQGNARITLNSVRTVTEREKGKPPLRVKRPVNIVLTGDRVNFQLTKSGDDYGTIVVTGDVDVTGTDTVLFGNMTGVKKVTIKLDAKMQPYDIESEGEPAVTKLTEKKGG
jgi:hypothetical protein